MPKQSLSYARLWRKDNPIDFILIVWAAASKLPTNQCTVVRGKVEQILETAFTQTGPFF